MSLPLGVLVTFGANDHAWARHTSRTTAARPLRAVSAMGHAGPGTKKDGGAAHEPRRASLQSAGRGACGRTTAACRRPSAGRPRWCGKPRTACRWSDRRRGPDSRRSPWQTARGPDLRTAGAAAKHAWWAPYILHEAGLEVAQGLAVVVLLVEPHVQCGLLLHRPLGQSRTDASAAKCDVPASQPSRPCTAAYLLEVVQQALAELADDRLQVLDVLDRRRLLRVLDHVLEVLPSRQRGQNLTAGGVSVASPRTAGPARVAAARTGISTLWNSTNFSMIGSTCVHHADGLAPTGRQPRNARLARAAAIGCGPCPCPSGGHPGRGRAPRGRGARAGTGRTPDARIGERPRPRSMACARQMPLTPPTSPRPRRARTWMYAWKSASRSLMLSTSVCATSTPRAPQDCSMGTSAPAPSDDAGRALRPAGRTSTMVFMAASASGRTQVTPRATRRRSVGRSSPHAPIAALRGAAVPIAQWM